MLRTWHLGRNRVVSWERSGEESLIREGKARSDDGIFLLESEGRQHLLGGLCSLLLLEVGVEVDKGGTASSRAGRGGGLQRCHFCLGRCFCWHGGHLTGGHFCWLGGGGHGTGTWGGQGTSTWGGQGTGTWGGGWQGTLHCCCCW